MKDPANWIWAYLHNELSAEETALFEQALKNNDALRQELDECRATHKSLETLLPEFDTATTSHQKLEETLLAEWEAEHPEYAEKPAADKPRAKILRFALPLAAAAAAVILFALPSPSIRWQSTVYGDAPQLRGVIGAQPYYTRDDLKQISRDLQNAVEAAGKPPVHWTLQISLQELAEGALEVEVSGHPRGTSGPSRVWNKNFQTLETFRRNLPMFGKQIASDLAGQDAP